MIVPCECGAKLKIDDSKISSRGVKVRCPRCGNIVSVSQRPPSPVTGRIHEDLQRPLSEEPLILVAHDSEVVRNMISEVLRESGFRVDTAADGVEALKKATANGPQGMVLDVGLPGIYGFELCERLKGNQQTEHIKIVLLSSVYDMRRYKRTPVSLYGADDYIEKHHIPDFLSVKLRKLLNPEEYATQGAHAEGSSSKQLPEMSRPPAREFEPSLLRSESAARAEEEPATSSLDSLGQKAEAPGEREGEMILPESISLEASIFQKEECDIPLVEETDPEAVEKARRFARIIVSDIALYNQEAVSDGLKNGTFYELLKEDVDEGRDLYEKRVPVAIKAKRDYYQEAFDNFIAAQKKIVH